ncbi:MAG: DUF4199 domain-containing protein [Acidobacteria bacterium]|nr:DUF4199 domain-containing protein [Acidobacteriota bacterium]
MKRTVLVFAAAAGALLVASLAIFMPLTMNGTIPPGISEVIGYTSMIASFLFVFFGIRSYRDQAAGGTISFWKAFQVGILITAVACAFYVVAWQVYYYNFAPDFFEKYTVVRLERMEAQGASAAELEETRKKMTEFAVHYRNPLINAAVTFLEPLPVGLFVTLVSAAVLRRKRVDGEAFA